MSKEKKVSKISSSSIGKKLTLKKLAFFAVILLLCLSLIPWVISNDIIAPSQDDTKWVKVGDKYTVSNIVLGEYNSFIEKNYYQLQQNPYILMQFLNNLISQYVNILLFANEAEDINLSVDKKLLISLISEIPAFANPDGTFNSDEFKSRITMIFGSEEVFMDNVRDNILKDQLIEPLLPLVNQPYFIGYIDLLAISQEKVVKYIEINKSLIKDKIPQPMEADLLSLRDSNKDIFTTLESRDGEYLILDANKLLSGISVTEKEIKDFYEKTKSSYLTGELRDIQQINFSTKDEAEKAYKEITSGSKSNQQFIEITDVDKDSLPEDFSKKVFSAKINDINKPVQSPIGWHVFKVTKVKPASVKPLSEVNSQIYDEVLVNKRNSVLENKRNEIINLINKGNSINDVASKTSSTFGSFKNLNEENARNNKSLTERMIQELHTLSEKSTSSLVDDDSNGNMFLIKLDKISPSRIKEINEIKPELLELWNEQKQTEKILEISSKIMLDLSSNKDIGTLGYLVKTFRGSVLSKDLPFATQSIDTVFTVEKNKPVSGVLKNNNKMVAIVSNAKNKDIYYDKKGIRNQEVVNFTTNIANFYTQSFFEKYATKLTDKYKIKVNEEAIMRKLAPSENPEQP